MTLQPAQSNRSIICNLHPTAQVADALRRIKRTAFVSALLKCKQCVSAGLNLLLQEQRCMKVDTSLPEGRSPQTSSSCLTRRSIKILLQKRRGSPFTVSRNRQNIKLSILSPSQRNANKTADSPARRIISASLPVWWGWG